MKLAAGLAASLLLISACSDGGSAGPEGTWGTEAEGQPQLVLADDGALSGTDGCNQLMGSWEKTDGDGVDFGEVASTMMFCEGVDTWLVGLSTGSVEGDTLHIFDASGTEIGTLARAASE
ncbi:META domain-containing protein [Ruaniaceae bacterium KH17]|nr:META domain-containing protein [Ruaniaceae bacterium KH17]